MFLRTHALQIARVKSANGPNALRHKKIFCTLVCEVQNSVGDEDRMLSSTTGSFYWMKALKTITPEIHRWIRPASLKQRTVSFRH
jgi:hypothetical protein